MRTKEEIKEYRRQWYLKHRKKILEYQKKQYSKNKDRILEWQKKNKDTILRQRRERYQRGGRLKEQNLQYYLKNREKILKRLKDRNRREPWIARLNGAKQRCNNPNNKAYKSYGGRGIKVLLTINEIKYLWFRDKAYNLKRPSIDRINNNGNYELSNCRFIELIDNIRRKRK
jgi:hypothetical protein